METTCDLCDREATTERGTPREIRQGFGVPVCGYHAACCDHCGRHESRVGDLVPNRGEALCHPCLDRAIDDERTDDDGWRVGEPIPSGPFAGTTYGGTVTPVSPHRVR